MYKRQIIRCDLKLGFTTPRKRPAVNLLATELDTLPCISKNPGIKINKLGTSSSKFKLEARTKPATIAPVIDTTSIEIDSLKSLLNTTNNLVFY